MQLSSQQFLLSQDVQRVIDPNKVTDTCNQVLTYALNGKGEEGNKLIGTLLDETSTVELICPNGKKEIEILEKIYKNVLTISFAIHSNQQSTLPPIGLKNGSNDCWANALIQVLANSPSFKPTNPVLQKILTFYYLGQVFGLPKKLGPLLREWSRSADKGTTQEDPSVALADILHATKHVHPCSQSAIIPIENTFFEYPMRSTNDDLWIPLDLSGKENNFNHLIEHFFNFTLDEMRIEQKSFKNIQIKRKFEDSAPKNLWMKANRFTQEGNKISTPIQNIGKNFTLSKEHTEDGKGGVYRLNGCVIHLGEKVNSGHYIALVRVGDKWFLTDDTSIEEIQDPEPYLAKGYLFHYELFPLTPSTANVPSFAAKEIPPFPIDTSQTKATEISVLTEEVKTHAQVAIKNKTNICSYIGIMTLVATISVLSMLQFS